MPALLVILTGASGAGKTSIAQWIEASQAAVTVYQGDRIGPPSDEIIAGYGPTDEPGGAAQRGFTLYWIGVISKMVVAGIPVLLETQCRIAFLHEALALHGIANARILLVECSDECRATRLYRRGQPELAHEQMSNWSCFLHREAEKFGHPILDTTAMALEASAAYVLSYFCQEENP